MKNLVDSCGWIEYFQDGPKPGVSQNLSKTGKIW